MNWNNYLDKRLVYFGLDVINKNDAINKIAKLFMHADKIDSLEIFLEEVNNREKEYSTGIGYGIAIPHCQSTTVKEASFSIVKLDKFIEWGSIDDKPVNFVIMLAAPEGGENIHLKMLSQLAMNLMDDDFRKGLLESTSIKDIQRIFEEKGE